MFWTAPRRVFMVFACVVVLAAAGNASAYSCSGDCEGNDCTGGCTIDGPTCGVACIDDGCPGTARCEEYGGSPTECVHSYSSTCRLNTQTLPVGGPEQPFTTRGLSARLQTDWSVIAYQTDEFSPLAWNAVEVLASTDRSQAERAVDELVARQREASDRLRRRVFEEGLRVDPRRPVQRRLHYAVAPAAGCVRVALDLDDRRLGSEVPESATLFLRATADAKGAIVAVELLHADGAGGAEARMIDFLKRHGRLSRTDGGEGAYEAFVVFYSGPSGAAGWIVSGSKVLF